MPVNPIEELRTIDPVLTTLAQGYSNESFIAQKLFPLLNVAKKRGKFPLFGKSAFSARETDRAPRALSNRIPPSDFSLENYELIEKDIETAIDYLEEEDENAFFGYERRAAKELTDILLLGTEYESARIANDAQSYNSEHVETLTSGNSLFNPEFELPDLIKDSMNMVRNKIGKFPNTLMMGQNTYDAILKNQIIAGKIYYSGLAKITMSQLKEIFEIENIYIGKAVISDDGETLRDIWGNMMVLAYVGNSSKSTNGEAEPGFGYTFRKKGMPELDTYYENGGKVKVIRATDSYSVKITCPDAGFLINNTLAQ